MIFLAELVNIFNLQSMKKLSFLKLFVDFSTYLISFNQPFIKLKGSYQSCHLIFLSNLLVMKTGSAPIRIDNESKVSIFRL